MSAGADAVLTDIAWIALGSNVGNRTTALRMLRDHLSRNGLRIAASSREIITRAVGVMGQRDHLNQVVQVVAATSLAGEAWLDHCKRAEIAAGRRDTYRWGPRRADADILLLGAGGELAARTATLEVPHPRIGERPFICALLASMDPGLRHPGGWSYASRASPPG